MLLKRIKAPTLDEALRKLARECGENALVVETRKQAGGYVVVAAREPVARVPKSKSKRKAKPRWTRGFADLAQAAESFGLSRSVLGAVERAMVGTKVELGAAGDPAVPGIATRILGALIQTGPLTLPDFKVTALVGPTGVGKTTTLAKLAARAQRDHDDDVAIISLDTYRIAAVEQLRAYADMLGAPLSVAFTPLDLERAVHRYASKDRIFIDTTGRSPFDHDAIRALRGALDTCRPACLLCIPAGTRREDAKEAIAAYDVLGPERIVLTKWDETRVPGEALSLAIEQGLAISHVTVGQEVPGDIVPADAGALAASSFGLDESQAEAVL